MKKLSLGVQIVIGIAVGLAIGFASPDMAKALSPLGTIFLRMLKMLIVPLMFFSITSGICKMGDVKQLVTVGLRYWVWILVTSAISAFAGVVAGLIGQPGAGTTEFLKHSEEVKSVSFSFIDSIIQYFPDNIVVAMFNGDMIQIIVFALFLGIALLCISDRVPVVISFIDQSSEAMMKITSFVMAFSPIGIASLMATLVSTISGATMYEILEFMLLDNICALILLFVMYPLAVQFLGKLNAVTFMKKITEPMLVSITTTSSAATLPVSIRVTGEKLGVPENVYGFTLPLGNACGTNGFALFVGLCCVFASNLYGFELTIGRIFQFVFLGIILSVGSGNVKGAGIVMSVVLMEALGMPLSLIPILAAIWPTIDPAHTVLNNAGDIAGTVIVANRLGLMDTEVFNDPNK